MSGNMTIEALLKIRKQMKENVDSLPIITTDYFDKLEQQESSTKEKTLDEKIIESKKIIYKWIEGV